MAKTPSSITLGIETITPQKAHEYLSSNTANRNIRRMSLPGMIRDMSSGRWQVNGDPIRFYSDGSLADGQHRLVACVEANKPFDTVVVRGLSKGVAHTIDQGAARNPGDVLKIAGFANTSQTAATIKSLICIASNAPRYRPSTAELLTVAKHLPQIKDTVKKYWMFQKPEGARPAILTGLLAVMDLDPQYHGLQDEFIAAFNGQHNSLKKYRSIHVAREFLRERARRGHSRSYSTEYTGAHVFALKYMLESDIPVRSANGMTVPIMGDDITLYGIDRSILGLPPQLESYMPSLDRIRKVAQGYKKVK